MIMMEIEKYKIFFFFYIYFLFEKLKFQLNHNHFNIVIIYSRYFKYFKWTEIQLCGEEGGGRGKREEIFKSSIEG